MRHKRPGIFDRFGMIRTSEAPVLHIGAPALSTAVRRGTLERPFRGVYRDPSHPDAHGQLRAALVHLGPEAVGVLGSAAIVHTMQGLPTRWMPQVALPPGLERQQRAGMSIHIWDLPSSDIVLVDEITVTNVPRTVADCCRLLTREHAVALVDSALHLGLLLPGDLDHVQGLMARRRNCVAGRRHLAEARMGAQSPGETRLRLIANDGGFPPDELQAPILNDAGELLGYADLGYRLPGGGCLAVEFDGRSIHELPNALLGDRRRQNAFLAQQSVSILRFAWEDTYTPAAVITALRSFLEPRGWRPGGIGGRP